MLSRVAENLYWMSRYVERAENVARLLDDGFQFELDAGLHSEETSYSPMQSLLTILLPGRIRAHPDRGTRGGKQR